MDLIRITHITTGHKSSTFNTSHMETINTFRSFAQSPQNTHDVMHFDLYI
jgi:hypothetical protein